MYRCLVFALILESKSELLNFFLYFSFYIIDFFSFIYKLISIKIFFITKSKVFGKKDKK